MYILTKELFFPPVTLSDEDGLVAIGGDLSAERLLLAYKSGIFPWYNEDEPICWYSPAPRFVLFPAQLSISKSMKKIIDSGTFSFTVNKAFTDVIQNCRSIYRRHQDGTWISPEIIQAYVELYARGYAHSAEAWCNGELAGGLYGIRMGNVFFGESMFNKQSNASKFAFIQYVGYLQKLEVQLIDCQVYSGHLQGLGATMIDRNLFLKLLTELIR